MKLLFLFALFFGLYVYKNRRFSSPFKLVMIFGKKGSGKSTYLVKTGISYMKKGYTVYTNLVGVNVPGFRLFDPVQLGDFVPPEKSCILLDEAGIVFDNRSYKSFQTSTRDFFKLQRHYKCVVYLASQSYDVDKKLRDLTDSMLLVQNLLPGISLLRPIRRKIMLTEASSMGESRIADNLKFAPIFSWRFLRLKKYSRFFDSFIAPERPELPYNEIGE